MGAERGGDLLNKRKCKFGELCSFNCLCLHFFKEGVIKRGEKNHSLSINWRRRDGERRAGRQLLWYGVL